MPGPDGGLQAPHINVTIFMRGMLKHLVTRIYFPDEPANAQDPVLRACRPTRRGHADRPAGAGDPRALAWNVRLQGDGETVFFDY